MQLDLINCYIIADDEGVILEDDSDDEDYIFEGEGKLFLYFS